MSKPKKSEGGALLPDGLDIDELKKQDALAKLTPEERALLGV